MSSAASMFTGHRLADRKLRITLGGQLLTPSLDLGRSLFPDRFEAAVMQPDHAMVEGARWRVEVGPGLVAVRRTDPVKADRARERAERDRQATIDQGVLARLAGREPQEAARGGALVTSWSARSRSRMAETFAGLDWLPMFEGTGDLLPAMVTLTYPGDWQSVAPSAVESRRHLLMLRKRYARRWGRPMVGVWKREFQRRGAPHWHLLLVPPAGPEFASWLSHTWASIVGSEWCGRACWDKREWPEVCCERGRHVLAGTGIDYADGLRARDPRSVGVYFAKHGSFAGKEYQNEAPAEWVEQGTVGRFWGVWGLDRAVAAVEVAPVEGLAAARTMRRYSRANSYVTRVPVWRYRTRVDPETGEVTARWRKASKPQRVYRVRRDTGYLVVKDGPAFASGVARYLDGLRRPEQVVTRSGAGPVGFLP
ncbi:MAG: rolling circle replication-associated protein [Dermatophilaceae bacterium]